MTLVYRPRVLKTLNAAVRANDILVRGRRRATAYSVSPAYASEMPTILTVLYISVMSYSCSSRTIASDSSKLTYLYISVICVQSELHNYDLSST